MTEFIQKWVQAAGACRAWGAALLCLRCSLCLLRVMRHTCYNTAGMRIRPVLCV